MSEEIRRRLNGEAILNGLGDGERGQAFLQQAMSGGGDLGNGPTLDIITNPALTSLEGLDALESAAAAVHLLQIPLVLWQIR